jgi:tetratricopeptide (TPR) repeat protein
MRFIVLISAGVLACSAAAAQQPSLVPSTDLDPAFCRNGLDALNTGDARAASSQLTQCLKLDLPDPVRAYILRSRARAYRTLDYPTAAVEDQKASLKLGRPFDAWPLINLAVYHRAAKQYPESLETLKQALAYDENGPGSGPGAVVLYHTGITLSLMGKHAEAVENFTKAIAKQPDFVGHVIFARAMAYEGMFNRAQAKQDLTKVSEVLPSSEYSKFMMTKFREYRVPIKPASR